MLKGAQKPCYLSHAIHIVPGGHEGICATKSGQAHLDAFALSKFVLPNLCNGGKAHLGHSADCVCADIGGCSLMFAAAYGP